MLQPLQQASPLHQEEEPAYRVVTERMCEKVPSISPGEKICDSCRKQLAAETEPYLIGGLLAEI